MKCRIKRLNNEMYFNKHLGIEICPNRWSFKEEAKIFNTVAEARATIKLFKIKNCEVEKIKVI